MKVILLGVLAMICAFAAWAEDSPRPLQPIDRPPIVGETKCSDLFYTTTTIYNGATTERIVLAYKKPDRTIKRDTVPKLRVAVEISETASVYGDDPATAGGILFQLIQADYEKSKACLPVPRSPTKPATP